MPCLGAYLFSATLLISFGAALAQTTHNITVGAQGSFYDPPTLSASVNDTVHFIFTAVHSVVQAAFDNPCFPLPSGFSSGLVKPSNATGSSPAVWTLKISNASEAIWFYCGNTVPLPHCASGMVGAINPPSISLFQQYLGAAKLVSVPPPPLSVALTGQGAFATATATVPTPTSVPVSLTPTPTQSSSSSISDGATSTARAINTPSPTAESKKGAIIGGSVVGGVAFLVILTLVIFFFFRRRNRYQRRSSKDFFRYRAQTPQFGPATSPSTGFTPSKFVNSPTHPSRQTQLPPTQPSTPASAPSKLGPSPAMRSTELSDTSTRASKTSMGSSPPPPPRRLPTPVKQNTALPPASPAPAAPLPMSPPQSAPASLPPLVDQKLPLPTVAENPGNERNEASPNIHVLAREVAAVLMQGPRQMGDRNSSSNNSYSHTESSAPPRYRASMQ